MEWIRRGPQYSTPKIRNPKTMTPHLYKCYSSYRRRVLLLAHPVNDHSSLETTKIPLPPLPRFHHPLWSVTMYFVPLVSPCCDYLLKCLPSSIDCEIIQSSDYILLILYPRTMSFVNTMEPSSSDVQAWLHDTIT